MCKQIQIQIVVSATAHTTFSKFNKNLIIQNWILNLVPFDRARRVLQ